MSGFQYSPTEAALNKLDSKQAFCYCSRSPFTSEWETSVHTWSSPESWAILQKYQAVVCVCVCVNLNRDLIQKGETAGDLYMTE